MLVRNLIAATVLGSALWASASHAEGVAVGKLDCDVSSGIGAIVGSKQDATCVFQPSGQGAVSQYTGTITSFGLDVGTIDKARLIWLVYAPTHGSQGGLEGTYRGVEANVSLGLGVGANALVGDGRNSSTLQPLSIEGERGLNLAVGVSEFKLRAL
ncbi:Hypothetical protein NGAL_HAMBI2605_66380 [Neorhizobium galegae bv. orientalis]|nr:Hypothetical protein NGAL_HAMBI2605_66380 [Neorhizobium galegae bv. orientalis]